MNKASRGCGSGRTSSSCCSSLRPGVRRWTQRSDWTSGAPHLRSRRSSISATAVFDRHKLLFAIQAYESVATDSIAELTARFESSRLTVYHINAQARNPGLLLGTAGWSTSVYGDLDTDLTTTEAGRIPS